MLFFRPVDVKKSDRGAGSRTVARYAIRSGPKQLSAYLTGNNKSKKISSITYTIENKFRYM